MVLLGSSHIVGAVVGGAATGGLLGWLGSLVSLATWRLEIVGATVAFALWHSVRRPQLHLGLRRQVPRTWQWDMPLHLCYFLWGILLGSGIATLIPYASFVVVLGVQLTAGVTLGCASGAVFGAARETMALLALVPRRGKEANPEELMCLLPALQRTVQRLNILWVIGGGLTLVIAAAT